MKNHDRESQNVIYIHESRGVNTCKVRTAFVRPDADPRRPDAPPTHTQRSEPAHTRDTARHGVTDRATGAWKSNLSSIQPAHALHPPNMRRNQQRSRRAAMVTTQSTRAPNNNTSGAMAAVPVVAAAAPEMPWRTEAAHRRSQAPGGCVVLPVVAPLPWLWWHLRLLHLVDMLDRVSQPSSNLLSAMLASWDGSHAARTRLW